MRKYGISAGTKKLKKKKKEILEWKSPAKIKNSPDELNSKLQMADKKKKSMTLS